MTGLIVAVDVVLGAVGLYLVKTIFFSSPRQKGELPPGPKPKPLIGNLLDLPQGQEWLHWAKHKDLYGPLSSITVFGQHMIIVNDAKIAIDLLEKKSSVYSDRPTLIFGGEMCGWENTLAMQHYNERFRAYRRNIHQLMGSRAAVSRFYPHQEVETRRFLLRVLDAPENLMQHIRTMAGAIILKISHGYTIEPKGADPLVDLADEALVQFSLAAAPGAWLVDVLPILRYLPPWIPGTGFQRTASRWFKTLTELAEKPHAFVKQQVAAGLAVPSYTSQLLEKGVKGEEEEFIIKWSAASLYSGGADTTVSANYSFFLAMVLHPEIQKKAQAEIDAVVGTDRLPTFADRQNLPYVDALVKEVLRWNPVAPMGLPHVTTEDDVYQGHFIPKGALLLANIWQFTHDPKSYKKPLVFDPERFLGDSPEMDPHSLSFGFGRRICPGKELADASVFIAIAMSLAAFNIRKAKDDKGNDIEPVYEYTTGIISHPKEYQCSITARSDKAEGLVRSIEEEHPWEASNAEDLMHVKWQ